MQPPDGGFFIIRFLKFGCPQSDKTPNGVRLKFRTPNAQKPERFNAL